MEENDLLYLMEKNFNVLIKPWAEKNNLMVCKSVVIGNIDGNTAQVYIPPDFSNLSVFYENKSSDTLVVGHKAYLFHLYGNTDQGWIFVAK